MPSSSLVEVEVDVGVEVEVEVGVQVVVVAVVEVEVSNPGLQVAGRGQRGHFAKIFCNSKGCKNKGLTDWL